MVDSSTAPSHVTFTHYPHIWIWIWISIDVSPPFESNNKKKSNYWFTSSLLFLLLSSGDLAETNGHDDSESVFPPFIISGNVPMFSNSTTSSQVMINVLFIYSFHPLPLYYIDTSFILIQVRRPWRWFRWPFRRLAFVQGTSFSSLFQWASSPRTDLMLLVRTDIAAKS
jgi:hypothetical protein